MTTATKTTETLRDSFASFHRHMRHEDLALNTQKIYSQSIEKFATFLEDQKMPTSVKKITREHVETFIDAERQRTSPGTAGIRHRSLQAYWKWAVSDERVNRSPMERMKHPRVPIEPVEVLDMEQIEALLGSCMRGTTFLAKRDHALLRVLLAGLRRSEAADLKMEDVDLDDEVLTVIHGKGRKTRRVPLSIKAVQALERYIRARAQYPSADLPYLFLGHRGRLGSSGVAVAVVKRGKQVGVKLHAHMLRHVAAHEWLSRGGSDTGLMKAMGWTSPAMLRRYAASRAEERMLDEAKRIGFGSF